MEIHIHPSKKRKLLAIYIDLLAFGVIWAHLSYFLSGTFENAVVSLIVFCVIEFVLVKNMLSPGFYLLSIHRIKAEPSENPAEKKRRFLEIVDPNIKKNENWVSILFGVLFLNSGAKGVVRWTEGLPTLPLFGFESSSEASILISIILGIATICIGCAVLKLNKKVLWGTVLYLFLLNAGLYMGRHQLPTVIERVLIQKSEAQGRQVSREEIKFLGKFVPALGLVMSVFSLGILFTIRKRLVN